jgi:uncharacterized protein YndB with AHSA1/START domain
VAAVDRAINKEVTVSAHVGDVWKAWTTAEGAGSFFAPRAKIELALGGRFELYFDLEAAEGSRGSEGCRILSYLPEEMISFDWNAPPQFPELRGQHTWVVVMLHKPAVNSVRVRLVHLGWRQGEEWDRLHRYFERAWDVVLQRLRQRFSTGPLDWSQI